MTGGLGGDGFVLPATLAELAAYRGLWRRCGETVAFSRIVDRSRKHRDWSHESEKSPRETPIRLN